MGGDIGDIGDGDGGRGTMTDRSGSKSVGVGVGDVRLGTCNWSVLFCQSYHPDHTMRLRVNS